MRRAPGLTAEMILPLTRLKRQRAFQRPSTDFDRHFDFADSGRGGGVPEVRPAAAGVCVTVCWRCREYASPGCGGGGGGGGRGLV